MKITIDTKEDSHEDIRKVLAILTGTVEKEEIVSNTDTANMMDMFNEPKADVPDTPPDFSSFLNLNKKEEEVKKEHKIEFF